MFLVCSGVCLIGEAIYMCAGSGELQPWTETTFHMSADSTDHMSTSAMNTPLIQADVLQELPGQQTYNATTGETAHVGNAQFAH